MRRILLYFFAGLTILALAGDAWVSLSAQSLMYRPLGSVWYSLHSASLNATQAGIQRYLFAWLWDPGIQTFLLAPAWIVPLGVTLGLVILKRRR
ncbi:MAG: hypothetical protein EP347_07640 [Alphaproteobacteria bacterium]|nr:MAG: hypothetical protein EP347_07640 [Alphaproteobacteria bacterium]